MESIRKWFYRPKRDDTSLLAQFFFADESLNAVACELDSFDGRQEPERCTTLVNQLRHCQDKVLTICNQIMDELIPESRANRDFRVKFPDDVMQENLAGQLWFGAECLAAGSSIMNREAESSAMRPLAKALTKSLEIVRNLLREHALKGHMNLKHLFQTQYPVESSLEKLIESLKIFDRLFADFELCYVGAMVPVKSTKEYEQQELVCVLFSETLQRALERGLLNQADVDNYEPALMFTIPRLAIVSGLLAPPGGPLCLNSPETISEMFQPFRPLLLKIRELLWTLNNRELYMLEKLLCSNEEPSGSIHTQSTKSTCQDIPDLEEFVHNFYTGYPNCKDFIIDFYTVTKNTGNNMDEVANDVVQILEEESRKAEQFASRKSEKEWDEEYKQQEEIRSENSNISINGSHNIMCNNSETRIQCKDKIADEDVQSKTVSCNNLNKSFEFHCEGGSRRNSEYENEFVNISGHSSVRQNSTEYISSPNSLRKKDDIDNRSEEDYVSADLSQILGNTENIEIPQTQYLLNQVSHENNITVETVQIQNSLADLDSKKLISEANKTLSNLLLDGECQNEISEQTDSGICTINSSENTSLYDKSPEERKTFANEVQQNETAMDEEDTQENTSYSCSSLNSPKRKNSTISESSCVCSVRSVKAITSLDYSIDAASVNNTYPEQAKNVSNISSNFDGTNEEFVGLSYGNGQLTVCDSNQSTFQINYSENWESLNLNIDASTSRKEFWNDLKCENCPSTSQSIDKIGSKIEKYAQDKITMEKVKEERQKRHQRKYERVSQKLNLRSQEATSSSAHTVRPATSTDSSRSNSTDRCVNPRITNYGASLHPTQNTRQMPNFGSYSPHASPRLHHFVTRDQLAMLGKMYKTISPQNRKDHIKTRSEQIARMKKRITEKKDKHEKDNKLVQENTNTKIKNSNDLLNDGLGPRTDKSGLVMESVVDATSQNVTHYVSKDTNTKRTVHAVRLLNPSLVSSAHSYHIDHSSMRRTEIDSGSSCSSCYDSSSETSEFQSDCQDDEEIALAMQAAEIANRNQIRAKFRSSEDLVHRLFVCISGVADQLQTNFASDLRNILKCVFLMNSSQTTEDTDAIDQSLNLTVQSSNMINESAMVANSNNDLNNERQDSLQDCEDNIERRTVNERVSSLPEHGEECVERAPAWIPDNDAPRCMACQAGFTVVRRRHHCRNCGKVFCGRCSSNNVPLPRYGHTKPVRVCNRCFLYQVTPFTVSRVTSTS